MITVSWKKISLECDDIIPSLFFFFFKVFLANVCVCVCVCVCVVLVTQLCLTVCDPMDCRQSGSSVHRILQARILDQVAIFFSRGYSRSRDWTWVSRIAGRLFTDWASVILFILFSFRISFLIYAKKSCVSYNLKYF